MNKKNIIWISLGVAIMVVAATFAYIEWDKYQTKKEKEIEKADQISRIDAKEKRRQDDIDTAWNEIRNNGIITLESLDQENTFQVKLKLKQVTELEGVFMVSAEVDFPTRNLSRIQLSIYDGDGFLLENKYCSFVRMHRKPDYYMIKDDITLNLYSIQKAKLCSFTYWTD